MINLARSRTVRETQISYQIMSKGITKRAEDYSKWYNELVLKADLAESSAVRGCMVIKPYGYSVWERMQRDLDDRFKDTGHVNAYFPLFIPKSFFSKEAAHVEGFAKECAVVTHYRLKNGNDGVIEVDETAKLEEELIVTSETIIWNTYKNWVQSYRDLPLLINQWANVVRWEMRTRLFLRTAEFLWQEGHTAHATAEEAIKEAEMITDVYESFCQDVLAMPIWKGVKSENERFAGAVETYCIEALMQDGKALQAGTSHFLGQNFARAFDVKFTNKEGVQDLVWATSWGVTTRLIGALIMTHSDDQGLVLPPRLAPHQVVIVPIYKGEEQLNIVVEEAKKIEDELRSLGIRVKLDDRDTHKPGWKFAEYELKGVPTRIAIGARDIEHNTVELARRDTGIKETVSRDGLAEHIRELLDEIQTNLYKKALDHRTEHTTVVDSFDEFKEVLNDKGGFVLAHWDGTVETEKKIKELTKATLRLIPKEEQYLVNGKCIVTGKPSKQLVVFAKAY